MILNYIMAITTHNGNSNCICFFLIMYHIFFILNFFFFFFRYTKPQSFADCVGDELPLGWEESYDHIIGRYYINHVSRKLLREIRSLYLLTFFFVQHRVDTTGGSAARMEEYTRAYASRVPDVSTGGASGKTRNL